MENNKLILSEKAKTLELRFINAIGYDLLFFALVYAYDSYIFPVYGYMGFHLEINNIKFIQSLLITFILGFFLPCKVKKPSDILIHIQFIFPVLPMIVIYTRSNQSILYITFVIFLLIIINLLTNFKIIFSKIPKIKITKFSYQVIFIIASFFILLTIFLIALLTNLKFVNFDLLRVYEFRSQITEILPRYFGYFYSMTSTVLIPTLLILSLYKKKYKLLPYIFILSILMFGLTSHKSVLFSPFLPIFIYFFVSWKYPIQKIILSCILIILINLFIFNNNINTLIPSLLVRRVYFVPALVNYLYYDFFSHNPKTLFADSKITLGLIEYPYQKTGAEIISNLIYPGSHGSANTGWLGSGYMNLGYSGMFLYSIIISFLFGCLNYVSNKMNNIAVPLSLVIIPFFTLFESSDLPTVLLNHGLILSFIILLIIPNKKNSYEH